MAAMEVHRPSPESDTRPAKSRSSGESCAPREDGTAFVFDNGFIYARIGAGGVITELAAAGGRSVAVEANVLALYRDRPRQWEAWNIDDGYQQSKRAVAAQRARIVDDALELDYTLGKSPATMRIELREGGPFLRAELACDWSERRTLRRG